MQIAIHKKAEEHQGTTCRTRNQQNAIKKNTEGDVEVLSKGKWSSFIFLLL